ncbi:uncharacterized protein LOC110446480 [Mizuhopecten yessoensis]|uniref:uncharacterized protein LOC110446480 n=1 Tax=Mizuhopecten yessoensis TaxID=6573 RepID=UPI000B45BA62|nr:uncharacterized protein LOC110446480 [Mizuhopecten yessoensis]
MIGELNGFISPELQHEWDLFRNGLTPYLTPREIYGSGVKFVGHICESLLRKDIIKYGEYIVLFEVVNSIDVRVGEIVERATTAIKDIKMKISALKPEARSDHNTHRGEYLFSELGQSYGLLKASSRPNERAMDGFKRENIISKCYKI